MNTTTFLAAAALLAATGTPQAALIDRGGGMVYDTALDITWLADMNHAQTSGHDADGLMTWDAARQWADTLVFGGHDDWRLPTLDPQDPSCSDGIAIDGFVQQSFGYGCTGGELSHLFVVDLGNQAGTSVLDPSGDSAVQIANLALFDNVQAARYWSGIEYASDPGIAWGFRSLDGFQGLRDKDLAIHATAVRDGDVAVPVPEPQTPALALAALAAALTARRRRAR